VHVFDELVTTLPDGVYYTKVTQKDRGLNLHGVAQSNARVSSLMRSLDSSTWFENPTLVEIKGDPARKEMVARHPTFILNISQSVQKKQGEEQAGTEG
jgi:type IV pilus assembly protein PilN